ncbi:MAG: hypothetical protein FGM41_00640 [Bacteroidetes bacterium]|nr:hypothetical protein [Bacteroidota bacterium]
MKNKIYLILVIGIVLITFNACKEDCADPIELTQDYKIYQNWYPYKENDTLRFFRPVENDTIVFYGGKFSFPFYDKVIACNCCGVTRNEYLQQTFRDTVNKYDLKVEMDGANFKFYFFGLYNFFYSGRGSELLYDTVVTLDTTYTKANRIDYKGHSCWYVPDIGVVKYAYENGGNWLFIRK